MCVYVDDVCVKEVEGLISEETILHPLYILAIGLTECQKDDVVAVCTLFILLELSLVRLK